MCLPPHSYAWQKMRCPLEKTASPLQRMMRGNQNTAGPLLRHWGTHLGDPFHQFIISCSVTYLICGTFKYAFSSSSGLAASTITSPSSSLESSESAKKDAALVLHRFTCRPLGAPRAVVAAAVASAAFTTLLNIAPCCCVLGRFPMGSAVEGDPLHRPTAFGASWSL